MDLESIKHICIIRLSSLGDIIHTLPAFQLIRKKFQNTKISWIAEPGGAKLLENFLGIDAIIPFEIKSQRKINRLKYLHSFKKKHNNHFDIIIDFQGLIKSSLLSYLIKGRKGNIIGFHKKNLKESIASIFYQYQGELINKDTHVINKNIYLLKLLDITPQNIDYPLLEISTPNRLQQFYLSNHLKKNKFLLFNIGAGFETKKLPTSKYIDIINGLKNFCPIVLLWGNEAEEKTAHHISQETGVIKSIFFNFSELILFIKQSKLLFTSDTLALHLADMVKTPSISIFGPTSPTINGSLLPFSVSIYKRIDCSFCYKRKCDKMDCINSLSTEEIVKIIKDEYIKIY